MYSNIFTTFTLKGMKRIKILCAVLLVIFFGSIYQSAVLPFIEGVKEGMTIAKYQLDNNQKTDDFLLMDVVSKTYDYFDNSEINIKTGEKALVRFNNMTVSIRSTIDKPLWWKFLHILGDVFLLLTLVLGVWVPFLVVKIIKSLQNSEIFEQKNIKRIQCIGIVLLVIGIVDSLLQVINIYSAQELVNLTHYNFIYSKAIDFNPIIMGVVILIMNEILKIGIVMKEEQDFTV